MSVILDVSPGLYMACFHILSYTRLSFSTVALCQHPPYSFILYFLKDLILVVIEEICF